MNDGCAEEGLRDKGGEEKAEGERMVREND